MEEYDGAPELTGEVIYEPGWYLLAVPPEAHARLLALLDPPALTTECKADATATHHDASVRTTQPRALGSSPPR